MDLIKSCLLLKQRSWRTVKNKKHMISQVEYIYPKSFTAEDPTEVLALKSEMDIKKNYRTVTEDKTQLWASRGMLQ